MKIAIAQSQSVKGDIQENIKNHLRFIEKAIEWKADLIVFPELSITNYESKLAAELARDVNDSIFDVFQKCADNHQITIGVGMPTGKEKDIKISMLIFQPNQKRRIYSKQYLHSDELPYFKNGDCQTYFIIKGIKIGIAICYESLQLAHFLNTKKEGATIYIASVAKPQKGIKKAVLHFQKLSSEYQMPILMVNNVGYCDNFRSMGQSAVWNEEGNLMEQLDDTNQGMIVFDTKEKKTQKIELTF
jgi:predicted amidohydrolase